MSTPTPKQVQASIKANSEQLNADDLISGPITVTIEKVTQGDTKQPWHISMVEITGKTFRPCLTCRRVMVKVYGEVASEYVGKQMTLYCDPDVKYGGNRVGGVRISHLSGLDKPLTLSLTTTRGKKAEITIQPLQAPKPVSLTPADQEFVATAREELLAAASVEELKAFGEILKGKPKPVQDALRPVYAKRQGELKPSNKLETQ